MNDLMLGDLQAVIHRYERNSPRSLQKEIGPSEVGQPCDRRLVMQLLSADDINTSRDNWPATVGTAVHELLAKAFLADNAQLTAAGRTPRWLVEQEVTIRPGLVGHTDLVDLDTWTIADHKTTSVGNLRKYRAAGHPGPQYETQAHLYGLGWARTGLPIRKVAIAFYPKSGLMRDSWMWEADYNVDVALAALDRMDGLLANANDAENTGELDRFVWELPRDTEHCDWCPFHTRDAAPAPNPMAGCSGVYEDPHHRPAVGRRPVGTPTVGLF